MPPRRVKAEKGRESTVRRSTRIAEPEPEDVEMDQAPQDEEEDEATQLERVLATIANYPDQPLEAVQEPKIRMIGVEINAHNNQYERALESIIETATMLSDALPGDTDALEHPEILRLKAALLTMLDNQHEVTLEFDTLDNDIRKPLAAGKKIVDPASILSAGIAKRLQTYNSQTSRQKYGKSKVFKNFINSVWESNRPDEPMPPALNFLPREDGDPEESDDDLEVGGVTQDYRCPITMQIYTDPLVSTTCGHAFQADAIREFVKTNRKCPAAGCDELISLGVLKQDRSLQKKAQAAKRRADRDDVQSEDSIDD